LRELLREYRLTLKETRVLIAKLDKKITIAKRIKDKKAQHILSRLQEDKKIINSWISNLQYSIEWLSTGRRPGATRGIENRAAYEREIPFEPYWIQRNVDHKSSDTLISLEDELENIDDDKIQIVKQILYPINKKRKRNLDIVLKWLHSKRNR